MSGETWPAAEARLARVAAWDAAGNHQAAIDELARGTRAGEPACARLLGMRLLLGDRAPLLPDQGLRFLGQACESGLPEAGARAAALVALGLRHPPNWQVGLGCLARSAAAGWRPAQRQLLALCDDRDLAARASRAASVDWERIAAAVQLANWHHSPVSVIHSDDPRVATVPRFIRPELCEVLIELVDGRLEPARVYDPVGRVDVVDHAHRSNTLVNFNVPIIEFVHVLLQERMSAACGLPAHWMETPAVLHYSPGEQIANHYDFVDPKSVPDYAGEIARNGQRLVTFLIYLNDDYEGGETAFPDLGFSHKGTRGEGLYFFNALPDLTPDLRMRHAGRPPTRGEKWIVTQFVRSRPTRSSG